MSHSITREQTNVHKLVEMSVTWHKDLHYKTFGVFSLCPVQSLKKLF